MSGYRYGEYHDGPDPLAAPFDARGALDELGDAVLDGADPSSALRDLLRRGVNGRRGLDDLLRRVRDRQREIRGRGPAGRDPGGSAGAAGHGGGPGAGRAVPRPGRRGPAARGRAGRAAVGHLAGHPQAGRLQLAQPGRPGDVRAAQGPAPQRGPGQPVPRHEGGAPAARPGGHAAGQGHDGRPQPDAGGRRPGRAHPGATSTASWTATATCSRRTRPTWRNWSTRWSAGPPPRSGCSARSPRGSATSWPR